MNAVTTDPATGLGELLASQDEKLMNCVHCGFCLPACPTYIRLGDENDSPRGRLYLMRAVVEDRLDPASQAFQDHIDRCLGCRACESVCPSGVEYGTLLERARAVANEASPPNMSTRALLGVFRSDFLSRLFFLFGRLFRATGVPALLTGTLPSQGVLGQVKLGLGMLAASRPVRLSSTDSVAALATTLPERGSRGRVALLTGCVQEGLFSRVNSATRRVLEANGFEVVDVVSQGCCGALHAHGGDLDSARALALRNVDAFSKVEADWIVVNAAGCGAVMKDYVELLESAVDESAGVGAIAGKVVDVSELLARVNPVTGGPLPLRATYDAPCHLLHAQGVADPPIRLLTMIPELELLPLDGASECCGGAGIYGITHPKLGGEIGTDKVRAILRTGAEVVATGNPGCMMQIGAGLRMMGARVEVVHPIELLDESYRRAGLYR